MFHDLDPRSPVPLYEQIAQRCATAIAVGDLTEGSPLPSVREVARAHRINPATVVQAYAALEARRLVERRQGAGTFVLGVSTTQRATERRRQAVRLVRGLITDATRLGLEARDLQDALDQELKRRP